MSQQRCTASAAFELLRQASQHRNRRLRDIAADLITNVTRQPPEPPPPFTADVAQPA
jgi:AmiR/NasT family two-component response regulator